jgi:hypothetical protein
MPQRLKIYGSPNLEAVTENRSLRQLHHWVEQRDGKRQMITNPYRVKP